MACAFFRFIVFFEQHHCLLSAFLNGAHLAKSASDATALEMTVYLPYANVGFIH